MYKIIKAKFYLIITNIFQCVWNDTDTHVHKIRWSNLQKQLNKLNIMKIYNIAEEYYSEIFKTI